MRGKERLDGFSALLPTALLVGIFSIGSTALAQPNGPTSLEVSKTASFDGRFVSGTISITNVGENAALISAIEDTLEVHFPRRSDPPPLPEGSARNWFEVADVAVAAPGLIIEVGETVDIDYSFDLCDDFDADDFDADVFEGANAMRNVVAVILANRPENAPDTFVTRSESFEPQTPECLVPCELTLPPTCGGSCPNPGDICETENAELIDALGGPDSVPGSLCVCQPSCDFTAPPMCGGSCPNPGEICSMFYDPIGFGFCACLSGTP